MRRFRYRCLLLKKGTVISQDEMSPPQVFAIEEGYVILQNEMSPPQVFAIEEGYRHIAR